MSRPPSRPPELVTVRYRVEWEQIVPVCVTRATTHRDVEEQLLAAAVPAGKVQVTHQSEIWPMPRRDSTEVPSAAWFEVGARRWAMNGHVLISEGVEIKSPPDRPFTRWWTNVDPTEARTMIHNVSRQEGVGASHRGWFAPWYAHAFRGRTVTVVGSKMTDPAAVWEGTQLVAIIMPAETSDNCVPAPTYRHRRGAS